MAILIKAKAHLKDEGFKKILSIKSAMNLGFSNALSLPNVVPADKPRFNAKDLVIQNSYRVASFTSGDGCFYVSIKKSDTTVSGYAVEIRLRNNSTLSWYYTYEKFDSVLRMWKSWRRIQSLFGLFCS